MDFNPYDLSFFVAEPNAVIHKVRTGSPAEIRTMEAFQRLSPVTGYQVLDEGDLEDVAMDAANKSGDPPDEREEDQARLLLPAFNGKFIEHGSPKAFFSAIGHDKMEKRRCLSQLKRLRAPPSAPIVNDPTFTQPSQITERGRVR